ncbi:E3 ubiquitin/ISG15 ligase TRIM25-like [Hyperolius riggenbachi]|uniref:E3 ubiquitin/ISG15 ligase TRIM25-like n=1 Tax=Hyperolius riggenbachi TaxID=752182 RepID=UPI0035A387C3
MASAGLREELKCSICLSIYTDPVTLRCGHNFCRGCLHPVLATQEGSGGYSCPECREKFQERPALQRNITLCNIVESFLSTQPGQEESQVFCTYCIHASVPAVKSCLLCEAFLCNDHLRVHKTSPEHILCDPTTSLENRKCFFHKKYLEYYSNEDAACVCISCRIDRDNCGDQVELLDEASKRQKKKLRNVLQELITQRQEAKKKVQSLEEGRRKALEKADAETERVRTKKDEMSRKMRHIEELCNMTDPLTVLQEPDTGDTCDTEEGDNEDRDRHDEGDLDVAGISHTLHTELADIMSGVTGGIYIKEVANIVLDINTASNRLRISDNRKVVFWSPDGQNYPEAPERFLYPQVLSSQSFSSGRHYWEVDVGGSEGWIVGMCYPSIDRKRRPQSAIGYNTQSWGLYREGEQYLVIHDSKWTRLCLSIPGDMVGIYLDYEAGKISFYSLGDPIRHLHTFTATFTEPLHIILGVGKGCIKINERSEDFS